MDLINEAPPSRGGGFEKRFDGLSKTLLKDTPSAEQFQVKQFPRPVAEVVSEVVADARLRRKARQLYDRPPRLIVETIAALAELHGDHAVVERILDQILAVPDEVLIALGGADVPPVPIYKVAP